MSAWCLAINDHAKIDRLNRPRPTIPDRLPRSVKCRTYLDSLWNVVDYLALSIVHARLAGMG